MLAERRRERGETQGEQRGAGPAGTAAERQIHRTYTGHIQDAVYVTRPGLASDIPGRTAPRLPLLDKSPSDIVN